MKKEVVVLSVGGSLIIPEKIDIPFLHKLKATLSKHKSKKFVLVAGGGVIARKYITALKTENKPQRQLAEAGIRATRMNAHFLMQLFGKQAANDTLPTNMKQVLSALRKNQIVICGALRFTEKATSDTTAAKLAALLKSDFINMTNVKGLFTDNPKTNPKAKFIPSVTWKDFDKLANKTKHQPGQHFVLDQSAATLIKRNKTTTYIINQSLTNLSNLLKGKSFIGTTIKD
jgi:uridylate kinase